MSGRRELFPHRPGLDGFRGVAVLGVLCFHAGFGWARGGYLGVSAFFTLSGFLIATLLLREREVTGTVRLRAFWARRARRLLPAGLLGLVLAVAYAWVFVDPSQLASVRADVIACIGYVANWRFVFAGRSYAELFTAPSPVQHYWSLAVEEQFYLVFPLIVAACGLTRARSCAVLATVLVVVGSASVLASFALRGPGGGDRVYYGTDTRAVELLAGALLAVVLVSVARRPGRGVAPGDRRRRRRPGRHGGVVGDRGPGRAVAAPVAAAGARGRRAGGAGGRRPRRAGGVGAGSSPVARPGPDLLRRLRRALAGVPDAQRPAAPACRRCRCSRRGWPSRW